MIDILLIIIGLFILIKGRLKVSDTKEVVRPQSTFWGLIMIGYGIVLGFFLETTKLVYSLIFFGSLIVISLIFVIKGKTITSSSAIESSKKTKRNLIILLVFIAIIVAVFYFFFKRM